MVRGVRQNLCISSISSMPILKTSSLEKHINYLKPLDGWFWWPFFLFSGSCFCKWWEITVPVHIESYILTWLQNNEVPSMFFSLSTHFNVDQILIIWVDMKTTLKWTHYWINVDVWLACSSEGRLYSTPAPGVLGSPVLCLVPKETVDGFDYCLIHHLLIIQM